MKQMINKSVKGKIYSHVCCNIILNYKVCFWKIYFQMVLEEIVGFSRHPAIK